MYQIKILNCKTIRILNLNCILIKINDTNIFFLKFILLF